KTILEALGKNPADFTLRPADNDVECARAAVKAVKDGEADFLMKGLLGTADLMRAVIDKETGLRTDKLISHVMLYEVDSYPKMLALTDGGMNTFPDVTKKADILENAAAVLKALGYASINAACICGAEVVNPKIQSTVDAADLSNMKERWAPYHMNVFGPVALDLAISAASCKHKRYEAPGAGDADILLVPTYEVGNGIGKAMTYFAAGRSAGIIVGAKVPIVLVSRADSADSKLASIALGKLVAANMA
ncbi:MAG: phosphate acyltransferase, partial [Eubacteriales bacterium]|nr:phosphate acyltransferase [Eubacteriales bacterium]